MERRVLLKVATTPDTRVDAALARAVRRIHDDLARVEAECLPG